MTSYLCGLVLPTYFHSRMKWHLSVSTKITWSGYDWNFINTTHHYGENCCCSVINLCMILCSPMNCSMPGFPALQSFLEFAQTHVPWICDAIQPSHPLSAPPLVLNLSQHQRLFQWVGSSHQLAKVLEFQLQNQSFQWTPMTNLL